MGGTAVSANPVDGLHLKDFEMIEGVLRPVRAVAIVLLAMICGALAGCFDIEAEIQFNPNETGDMKVRLGFDREMGDVLDFVQTLAKFSDNPAAAVFSSGVCSQAALVQAPAEVQRHARVRRYTVGNQLYCEASVHLPRIDMEMPNPDGYGMFSFERTGPKRWRIALDLERLPDLTPFMMMGMMATLESDPRFGARIRGAEAMEIVAGAKKANVALMAMLMRGRHIKYTIRAPRIVSSIGAFERGDQAVVFRFKFDELMEMVMDETARQGKVYAVEVAN